MHILILSRIVFDIPYLYIQHTITLHLQYRRQVHISKKMKHDIILYQTQTTPQ